MGKKSVVDVEVPFFRTPFNYDRDAASEAAGLECLDPSLAQHHLSEEADINTIVKRFHLTGQLPSNLRMPEYQDFDQVYDFHSAMNAIKEAEATFMALPAEHRARFGNDPQRLIAFLDDPANHEEAGEMGFLTPAAVERMQAAKAAAGSPVGDPGRSSTSSPEGGKGGVQTS